MRIFFSDEHKVRILWRREVNREVNSSETKCKVEDPCGGLLKDVTTTITKDERRKERINDRLKINATMILVQRLDFLGRIE